MIYLYMKDKTLLYVRYIDDLFFVWKETKEKSPAFFGSISKAHPSIKFDLKYSNETFEFLDTKVLKNKDGKLCITFFRKPKNRKYSIHFKFAHPFALQKVFLISTWHKKDMYCDYMRNKTLVKLKDAFLKHANGK